MNVEVALGSVLAGFRVERLLGSGAMGAVYLAEDVHLKRKVAVKVLSHELAEDERFRRRFLVESQLAAGLEHPHIVPIYGAGEVDDLLYLAMKYVEGYDLRELIEATERVGDERAVKLLVQIGDALDTAHGLGLVHRDVKPANILIGAGEAEHAYLCDFGLARHASTVMSLTSERGFMGTIAYVAPEQIESGAVDARADVYALGCVLFECLTGAPPFDRDGDLQVVFAHLKEPPPLVTSFRPDLPETVDAVIQRALAKAPDERFSTCGELLGEAVEALKVKAPAVSRSPRRTIPGVRTFMIADVRGYTRYTAEHGDEAAAELATSFAEIVRQVVEERSGRLIELRGDEALVVFDSARQALRSAVELQARVTEAGLPRGVGVGLDAGEAVPVADGYRGGALNLAARLCSLAGPGEVLATETVLQVARAVPEVTYGERRSERVKGIAKAVTAVEVWPADRRARLWSAKRLRRAIRRELRTRRARVAGALVLAGGVAVGLFLALAGTGSAAHRIAPKSIGFVSAAGKLEEQLPVGATGTLGRLGHTLWFANGDDKTLERIDVRTRKLVHPFVPVQEGINGFTVGLGAVWAVSASGPAVLRIDPHYLTVQRIRLPAKKSDIDFTAPTEAVIGAGSVWVAEANKVFRIDPKARRVVKAIGVPQADIPAFGDGSLWVASSNTSSIRQIDPRLNQVVRTVRLRNWISSIAVGGGFVWATVDPDDTLWKIDRNGTIVKTLDVGHGSHSVTWFDGAAWLAANGRLQRVDPNSDAIKSFDIVDRPEALAPAGNALYVSTGESPPRLEPLPADEVATFSLAENWLDDIDPAHAWPIPYRAQLEYATAARLLNYPDAPAPAGSRLVPEVAAAMPRVSADGRTYTFRIRRGFRFSPPSNQEVTAETFKYSIERALSPGLGPEAPGSSTSSGRRRSTPAVPRTSRASSRAATCCASDSRRRPAISSPACRCPSSRRCRSGRRSSTAASLIRSPRPGPTTSRCAGSMTWSSSSGTPTTTARGRTACNGSSTTSATARTGPWAESRAARPTTRPTSCTRRPSRPEARWQPGSAGLGPARRRGWFRPRNWACASSSSTRGGARSPTFGCAEPSTTRSTAVRWRPWRTSGRRAPSCRRGSRRRLGITCTRSRRTSRVRGLWRTASAARSCSTPATSRAATPPLAPFARVSRRSASR